MGEMVGIKKGSYGGGCVLGARVEEEENTRLLVIIEGGKSMTK